MTETKLETDTLPELNGREICCVKVMIEPIDGQPFERILHMSFPRGNDDSRLVIELTDNDDGTENLCLHVIHARNIIGNLKKVADDNARRNHG